MATFLWEGKTRDGALRKGVMVADNDAAVMSQLRSQNILPTRVRTKPKDIMELIPLMKRGVAAKDIVVFTRQFATMIDAGLPLVQCLEILGNQSDNKIFKNDHPRHQGRRRVRRHVLRRAAQAPDRVFDRAVRQPRRGR